MDSYNFLLKRKQNKYLKFRKEIEERKREIGIEETFTHEEIWDKLLNDKLKPSISPKQE